MKSFISFYFILLSTWSAQGSCLYSFDTEKATVKATGFKYTEKKAVEGQFTGFSVNKNTAKEKPVDLLTGLVVTVDLMTLDSGNSLRDKNMRETLFANIVGDSKVTVTVDSYSQKKINATFKMNDRSQKVVFDYQINGKDSIQASGVVDFAAYAMGDQLAALKKRCGSLHTGEDGQSVTWSDFKLNVMAPLTKTCPAT